MTEKEFRTFNENMARCFGPDQYHRTKVWLIRMAEAVKRKKIIRALKSIRRRDGFLLDVGCGACDLLKSLPFPDKVGLDYSMHLLNLSRREQNELNLVQGNAENLPFREDRFSCIMLTDVLEHVLHPERVLEEIHRLCRKAGLFILNVPNDRLINRCKSFLQYVRLEKHFVTEYHCRYPASGNLKMSWHIHEFTFKDVKQLLEKRWNIIKFHSIPNALMPFQFLFFLSPKK